MSASLGAPGRRRRESSNSTGREGWCGEQTGLDLSSLFSLPLSLRSAAHTHQRAPPRHTRRRTSQARSSLATTRDPLARARVALSAQPFRGVGVGAHRPKVANARPLAAVLVSPSLFQCARARAEIRHIPPGNCLLMLVLHMRGASSRAAGGSLLGFCFARGGHGRGAASSRQRKRNAHEEEKKSKRAARDAAADGLGEERKHGERRKHACARAPLPLTLLQKSRRRREEEEEGSHSAVARCCCCSAAAPPPSFFSLLAFTSATAAAIASCASIEQCSFTGGRLR